MFSNSFRIGWFKYVKTTTDAKQENINLPITFSNIYAMSITANQQKNVTAGITIGEWTTYAMAGVLYSFTTSTFTMVATIKATYFYTIIGI